MVKRFGFGRKEKLKSRKKIEELFVQGQRFTQFPVRVSYQIKPTAALPSIEVGVTASRKFFKKAKDRNRIKRLLREAYRLQKENLWQVARERNLDLLVFFMYADKTVADFEIVKKGMQQCLSKLVKAAKTYEIPS